MYFGEPEHFSFRYFLIFNQRSIIFAYSMYVIRSETLLIKNQQLLTFVFLFHLLFE